MRGLNFLHRQYHKFFPPPIPSPYLYGSFGKALRRILTDHASRVKCAVEFGIFHGYTTSIIANALPPGARFYSYDAFDIPEIAKITTRKDIEVRMRRKLFSSWAPFEFDFMWLDIAATEDQLWVIHKKLQPYLKNSVVLSEGTHRTGDKRIKCIPSEDLCTIPPGIFRLLP